MTKVFLKYLTRKSNLMVILMALVCGVSVSCGDDDDPNTGGTNPPPTSTLSVSPSSINLNADGSNNGNDIIVTATNTDWSVSVTKGSDWLKANKNGDRVSISADENKDAKDRNGEIVVNAIADASKSCTISVNQKGTSAYIKVNGLESTTLMFLGGFDGKSGIDYQQKVTIDSNVEWSASGIPSWLSVSPTNGNGKIEMSIYPTSENNSSDQQEATIKLTGGNVSASIKVTQSENLSTVRVTPSNLVALWNAIGWDLIASGAAVNKFHWLCVSEKEMNRLTDAELLNELLNQEALKFVDDYMFFPAHDSNRKEITQNTTYYICTVAFDTNEKRGEVVKSKVTTPPYADGDNDAWVSFLNGEISYNSYSFQFTTVKEGFCDTYHVIYGNMAADESYSHVAFAFEINYFKKNGKRHWLSELYDLEIVTDYPNNHTFTHTTYTLSFYPLIAVFARGVYKDGRESSDLRGGYLDVSANNIRMLSRTPSKPKEDIIIRRSVEEARAKKYKK